MKGERGRGENGGEARNGEVGQTTKIKEKKEKAGGRDEKRWEKDEEVEKEEVEECKKWNNNDKEVEINEVDDGEE